MNNNYKEDMINIIDTLKELGNSNANTIMLPNGVGGLNSIADQIREATISGNIVK